MFGAGRYFENMNQSYISEKLGEAEVLAQLAEEAAELAQAALKLRRALDGKNPTPKTEDECRWNLEEEYNDVILCAVQLGLEVDACAAMNKIRRWQKRLGIGEFENV